MQGPSHSCKYQEMFEDTSGHDDYNLQDFDVLEVLHAVFGKLAFGLMLLNQGSGS